MDEVELALSHALNQTGFPFEHFAFTTAQAQGWNTRSNRLYIDPEEEKTREMDLLCYRYSKGSEVVTVTAVLISCKARTGKPWVLLTRPWPGRNSNWYPYPPVAVWSNYDVVRHEVEKPAWGLEYFTLADATGLKNWASDSPQEVFALHEFDTVQKGGERDKGVMPPRFRANGDSSMYEGAMSLLKALVYETQSVQQRKGSSAERLVYQFNLVQLLDGDLYEAAFKADTPPLVRKVERYRHFARTMLGGKDFSARIEFCTRPAFAQLLQELGGVHDFNRVHFDAKVRTFFETVLSTPDRRDALVPELARRLALYVSVWGSSERPEGSDWLRVAHSPAGVAILLTLDEPVIQRLRESTHFMEHLRRIVRDIYRYSGPIELLPDDDIPF
ncbi:hypothetical protein [Hydrogenophaga pseudoflava]|uniref:hypothetical protein n=1 Tax=Hydrogenophaga pseudoflava TaxID=47421 RepID=UPI0027E3BA87|nr:hypothetical protein [Hydrogenophaga pseudoflava]MDQ7745942.1 hypothetical protein [Hydrogenophaga pseudoflava]